VRSRLRTTLAALLCAILFTEVTPVQPALAAAGAAASSLRHVHVALAHVPVASAVPPARIAVKEPMRVKRPFSVQATRPKIMQAVRPANGVRLAGPPMVRPRDLDAAIASARRRNLSPSDVHAPIPRTAQPRLAHGATAGTAAVRRAQSLPSDPTAASTGINPWWRYQEQGLPGGGHMMVNVGTGNLLVQQDDMNVPHKGIALAFRRTYNSQEPASITGSKTVYQSLYGNGWTNTFNAHLLNNAQSGYVSVFDIDGARYDYLVVTQPNGTYSFTPPPGQHATLSFDGHCGYVWTKKSGTSYYFYKDNPGFSAGEPCPITGALGGYAGRLYQIIGRNRNTYVTFSYAWDNGDASATGEISTITATTESGMSTALNFADVNGRRLLQSLTMPDGATTVQYGYDALGNLTSVSRPPNNASGTRPPQIFQYGTVGSDSVMTVAASPRWDVVGDGAYLAFAYTGSSVVASALTGIAHVGVMNPTPADGTNTVLQPGYSTGPVNYRTDYYMTGVSTPTYRDTDGHMTNWVVDGLGRPTQTQECTASTNQGQQCIDPQHWLVSNESWDANNDLVSEVDPRGYETDYAYDAMGNTIAVAEPQSTTSQGTFRPTKLYDYDANNNVVAYCDEGETHAAGGDWTSPPAASDSRCSTLAAGVPHFTAMYTNPSHEPNGELASMTTPLGYARRFAYSASQQGGTDYGLPTAVTGDLFTQFDGTSLTPTQSFWYDANGLPRCYSNGQGTTVINVDALGRTTMVADGDDSSANSGSICGKSGGQAGWNTQTTYAYFADGSLQSSQTPAQRAAGVSTTFTYDLDGDETSETHYFGCTPGNTCTPGVTNKWYDGADRLVEVGLPHDPSGDAYSSTWLTRYMYDLSSGGTVSLAGTSFRAYGGLYKTQESVPPAGSSTAVWTDQKGSAFDALDRETVKYTFSPSSPTVLRATTNSYDASGNSLGLLASTTDPLGENTAYTYNEAGRALSVQFTGDGGATPSKSFVYDASGRVASATGAVYGTETNQYDADGRLVERDEPTSGAITSPARLTYDYYPNGQRKALNIASSALNAMPAFSYAYRVDGQRTRLHQASGHGDFVTSYTDGGRAISQSDPYTGTVMPNPQSPVPAGSTYGPTTWAYDATGQLTTITLPQTFAYQLIKHDDEGAVVGWTGSNSTYGPASMVFQNTVRGENVAQTLAGGKVYQARLANGAAIPVPGDPISKGSPPNHVGYSWDPVNAAMLTKSQEQYVSNGDPEFPGWIDCGTQVTTNNYDAASRMVGTSTTFTLAANSDCGQANTITDYLYTFDAENHHTSVGGPDGTAGDAVAWTPTGHAYKIGGNYLHYDGDQMLFVTDANGALVQAKTEMLADYSPAAGQQVLDRGISGQLVSRHNGSFYGGVSIGESMYRISGANTNIAYIFYGSTNDTTCWQGSYAQAAGCAPGGSLDYNRPEGFGYGRLTFQGARAVDSTTGQWTTPDAYAGDVDDPMTQKSFMWDRNNPYAYADPTGFDASDVENWIRNVTSPGRNNGSQSGGLSQRNIQGVADDLKKGTETHIQKFLDGLSGAVRRADKAIEDGAHEAADKAIKTYNDAVSSLEKLTKDASKALEGKPGGGPFMRFGKRIRRGSHGVEPHPTKK
jgi:YD repeat-containing protein